MLTAKGAEGVGIGGDSTFCRRSRQPPRTWPYFVLVPLVVLLFAFNRWLRNKAAYHASASTAIAALRPLMAMTLPPGCVQAPHR